MNVWLWYVLEWDWFNDFIYLFKSGKQGAVTSQKSASVSPGDSLWEILGNCNAPNQSWVQQGSSVLLILQYCEMLIMCWKKKCQLLTLCLCCIGPFIFVPMSICLPPPSIKGSYWKRHVTVAFSAKEALFRKRKKGLWLFQ